MNAYIQIITLTILILTDMCWFNNYQQSDFEKKKTIIRPLKKNDSCHDTDLELTAIDNKRN